MAFMRFNVWVQSIHFLFQWTLFIARPQTTKVLFVAWAMVLILVGWWMMRMVERNLRRQRFMRFYLDELRKFEVSHEG